MASAARDDLPQLPARRLAALVRSGELSPGEVVEAHLRRIDQLDGQLGAFVSVRADAVRDEQAKVLHAVQLLDSEAVLHDSVRGQYGEGVIADQRVRSYRSEPGVSPESRTDWRWYSGVYLTTRTPLFLGVFPNLSYTYSRTVSTVPFYRAERHRARLGLRRTF